MDINFDYLVFPDSTTPLGCLPNLKAAQACWYYYILCQKQYEKVGRGPEDQVIEVPTGQESSVHWMDKHYLDTLGSLSLIYQLGREEILKFFPAVIAEAERLGLPTPRQEYMNPRRFVT